jgi:hypothetical protein
MKSVSDPFQSKSVVRKRNCEIDTFQTISCGFYKKIVSIRLRTVEGTGALVYQARGWTKQFSPQFRAVSFHEANHKD